MKRNVAWILGGGSIVSFAFAMSMAACSSPKPNGDAGGPDSGGMDSGGMDVNNNDTGIQDSGGPDCKTVPMGAPFTSDAGPYCPFQADGGSTYCGTDSCCHVKYSGSSTPPDFCAQTCTLDAGTVYQFQCEQTSQCGTGQVCCLTATGSAKQDQGCNSYYYVSGEKGTSCMASCGGQPQICSSNSECPTGKTCFPLSASGIWIGVCE